jgi:tetratricopeptide (TPR) repeat protein
MIKRENLLFTLLFAIVTLTTGCAALLGSSPESVMRETGEDFLIAGDYEGAIKTFESLLSEDPKDVKSMDGLGVAYYEQGKYDSALEKFNRAKELDSDDERARLYLGLTYLKKGEDQKALAEWKEYTELISTGKFTELIRRAIAILGKHDATSEEREFVLSSIEYATQQERKVLVQEQSGSSYSVRSSGLDNPPLGIYSGYGLGIQSLPSRTIIIRDSTSPSRTGVRSGIQTRIRALQK